MTEEDKSSTEFAGSPFEGDTLVGPQLRARFKHPEDVVENEMFSMVTPGFPPYVLIVFDGPGSAHFKMIKSTDPPVNVGPYMLQSIAFHLNVVARLSATQNMMSGVASPSSGIVTPGMKLPPDFDAGP
jgi:hypothetical protein